MTSNEGMSAVSLTNQKALPQGPLPPDSARWRQFSRVWGSNWTTGKFLLPHLRLWAQGENGIVLDLGCGESPFSHLFHNASQYLRADLHPGSGRSLACRAESVPVAAGAVDLVLLLQMLGDLPWPDRVLAEAHRVLKPGGELIVFESTCYPEHDLPSDYLRIMPKGLEHFATEAGFECLEMIRLGGLFTRSAQLWNTCVMGRLRQWPVLGALAPPGVLCANVAAFLLDTVAPHPALAANYVARLRRP